MQDVAYGTNTLKLSNGEKMEIPNVVKTVTASRIVDLYQQCCQEPVSFHMGGQPSSVFYRYVSKQNHDSKSDEERKRKKKLAFFIFCYLM